MRPSAGIRIQLPLEADQPAPGIGEPPSGCNADLETSTTRLRPRGSGVAAIAGTAVQTRVRMITTRALADLAPRPPVRELLLAGG